MDKKMTDKEIIKAFEKWFEEIQKARQAHLYHTGKENEELFKYGLLIREIFELINRLQAENARLKTSNRNWRRKCQRLRAKLSNQDEAIIKCEQDLLDAVTDIERLSNLVLKEMIGEQKEENNDLD